MPFSVSFHPGNIHPADVHPIEAPHSSGAEPGGNEHPLLAVKPGHDPFSPSSSGLAAGGKPMKSALQKATWPDKQGDYFVKPSDVPDADGSRPAYQRDEETGAPMLTHERAKKDGHGSWKIVSDTNTAPPARGPALPPAAKIDPKQLGALKPDGTYPGPDGNSYLHMADGYHPASFDKQLQVWRINDPERPNDFSRSVPVKPDGKGGGELLNKPEIKGGVDDQRPGSSKGARSSDHSRELTDKLETLNVKHREIKTKLHALNIAIEKFSSEVQPLERDLARVEEKINTSKYVSSDDLNIRYNLQQQVDPYHHKIDSTKYAIDATDRELGDIERQIASTESQLKRLPS